MRKRNTIKKLFVFTAVTLVAILFINCVGTSASSNSNRNIDVRRYYYNQLSEESKKIYDNLDFSKEEIFQNKEIFLGTISGKGEIDEIFEKISQIRWAYKLDNPMSSLWLRNEKFYLDPKDSQYDIIMKPNETGSYYEFESEEELQNAIEELETKVSDFIKNLSGTDENKLHQIHDWIIDGAKYDKTHELPNTHDIYGALVKKECVCRGYAYAFKYVADKAGIPVISVVGLCGDYSTDSTSDINHAWNNIYINEEWSLVDITGDVTRDINQKDDRYFNISLEKAENYKPTHILRAPQ